MKKKVTKLFEGSFFLKYNFLCVCVLLACMCVAHACPVPKEPEESPGSPETQGKDGYELPWGCWELNPSPSARAVSVLNFRTISVASFAGIDDTHF